MLGVDMPGRMVRVTRATGKHRPGPGCTPCQLGVQELPAQLLRGRRVLHHELCRQEESALDSRAFLASFTRLRSLPSGPCRTSSPQAPPGCAARPWSGPEGPAICLKLDALPPLLPLSEHPPSGCRHPGHRSPGGTASESRGAVGPWGGQAAAAAGGTPATSSYRLLPSTGRTTLLAAIHEPASPCLDLTY